MIINLFLSKPSRKYLINLRRARIKSFSNRDFMLSRDSDVQAMIANYQINPRKLSSRRLTSAIVIFGLTLGSSAALAPVAQASRTFVSESATYDTAATIEFAVPVFSDGDF